MPWQLKDYRNNTAGYKRRNQHPFFAWKLTSFPNSLLAKKALCDRTKDVSLPHNDR
jgi:hypothetical protein